MQPHKIITLIFVSLMSVLYGCYVEEPIPGPPGPPGFDGLQGPQGPPGVSGTGLMYELDFNLNADNNWEMLFEFPPEDEILWQDVVLVYLLWDVEEADDGTLIDVWRSMPVSYFYDEGELQLNYDFTVGDVKIFAEAAFPLEAGRDFFNDVVARVVVVPAVVANGARLDKEVFKDYETVRQLLNLPETHRQQGTPLLEVMRNK